MPNGDEEHYVRPENAVTREEFEGLTAEVARLCDAVLQLTTEVKTSMLLRRLLEQRLERLSVVQGRLHRFAEQSGGAFSTETVLRIIGDEIAAALEGGDPEPSRGAGLEPELSEPQAPAKDEGEVLFDEDVTVQRDDWLVPSICVYVSGKAKEDDILHVRITRREQKGKGDKP